MKFRFKKVISQSVDREGLINEIAELLKGEELASVTEYRQAIHYDTHNIFRYFSWHKYSLVDSGHFYFVDNKNLHFTYSVTSYRLWILVLCIFAWVWLGSEFIRAMALSGFIFLFTCSIIWFQHYLFFNRITQKVLHKA
jgi:hypothetical protein